MLLPNISSSHPLGNGNIRLDSNFKCISENNLDKEIDGLNTTIGIKGEEITQLQNVNQQRVDKIDDGSYNKLTDGDTLFDDNYGKVGNGEDGTAKEVKGLFGDEFSENLNQFGGTIGLLAAVAGKDEATAKVMTIVAKLQMARGQERESTQ